MKKNIVISHVYMDNKYAIVEKINEKLSEHGLMIVLRDITPTYDDNRVYRTGERQLDTRIDGSIMLAEGQRTDPDNKYIVTLIFKTNSCGSSLQISITALYRTWNSWT